MNDAVEQRSHRNIFAASDEDLQRQRERERRPLPPVPWRFHAGTWQRWSELDREFAPHEPPGSLVEHAQATGGPVEDQELELVDGAWAPAGHRGAGRTRVGPAADRRVGRGGLRGADRSLAPPTLSPGPSHFPHTPIRDRSPGRGTLRP